MVEVVAKNLLGGDGAAACDLHISEAPQLREPIVEHPDPGGQTRQARLQSHPAPKGPRSGFGKNHVIAALTERHRRLEPGRSRPHDEDLRVALLRADPLRMPPPP